MGHLPPLLAAYAIMISNWNDHKFKCVTEIGNKMFDSRFQIP